MTGVKLDLAVDAKRLALNNSGSSVGLGGLIALKSISGGSLFTLVCLDPCLRGGRDGYSFVSNYVRVTSRDLPSHSSCSESSASV